jgi:hypothetical protein
MVREVGSCDQSSRTELYEACIMGAMANDLKLGVKMKILST